MGLLEAILLFAFAFLTFAASLLLPLWKKHLFTLFSGIASSLSMRGFCHF